MRIRMSFFCVCEGQQEQHYLTHIGRLLNRSPQRVVKFNCVVGNPHELTKKANYYEYDKVAVFDHDMNRKAFVRALELCDRLNSISRRRKQSQVFHAYSNVNFDLWLILHKRDYNRPVGSTDAYRTVVRDVYGLPSNADIKHANVMGRILEQISLEDVWAAIHRADVIRQSKLESDCCTIGSTKCYPNPDFSIHDFLRYVLEKCGEIA